MPELKNDKIIITKEEEEILWKAVKIIDRLENILPDCGYCSGVANLVGNIVRRYREKNEDSSRSNASS